MKFILASIFLFSPLLAASQNEMLVVQELIETTMKNLEAQQRLLKILLEFREAREDFLTAPDSGRLATHLVKCSIRLHSHLEKERLSHLFSSEFLTELAFYNQMGKQSVGK